MNAPARTRVLLAFVAATLVALPVQAHSVDHEYDLPNGVTTDGPAVSTRPCAPDWHEWGGTSGIGPVDDGLTTVVTTGCRAVDPEEDGAVRIGVYHAVKAAEDHEHRTWTVTATDRLGNGPYLVVCDSALGPCSEPVDVVRPHAEGCGSVTLTFPQPVPLSALQVWLYASHTDPASGGTCIGSKGTLTLEGSD